MSHLSEAEFREKVEAKLSKYFHLYKEEKGYYYSPDGKKSLKRLDLVIKHKIQRWLVFGIEFKHNGKKRGYDLAMACNQMREYSYIKWDYKTNAEQWGRIPIIACPHISLNYLKFIRGHQHEENHDHNNVNSFLAGGFNIGEIRPKEILGKRYMRICFANKVLWRELDYSDEGLWDNDNYMKVKQGKLRIDNPHFYNYNMIRSNIDQYTQDNYGQAS